MRKFLALVLGVLFVLSFAASAFAIHAEIPSETQAVVAAKDIQITLSGEIRTRGWYTKNIGEISETTNSYGLLNVAGVVENIVGSTTILVDDDGIPGPSIDDTVITSTDVADAIAEGIGDVYVLNSTTRTATKLPKESKSAAWYDERIRLAVDAKVSPNVEGFVMLESNFGQSDVYTWGNFNSKPTDMNILESWILYSGSGLFGFPSGVKIGHMPLTLGNKEFFDHTKFGDDAIVFFMDPIKPMHIALLTIKLAGDGSNSVVPAFDNLDASGSKYNNTDDLDGYVALMTYKINDSNTVGVNYTFLNQSDLGFSHQNLGIHANGNIGAFGYTAAGDIQFGKIFKGTDAEAKFKGYAVQGGLNFNINPVNLRVSGAYGSGSEADDDDVKEFITYLGADQHYTLVYEYQVTSTAGRLYSGLANTTYGNLGIDFNATKELALSVDGYYLRATKTDNGISKTAGWEVDGKLKYALAKNLTYQVDAGYFKSGDFYEDTYGIDSKGVTVLRHSLTLSF